MKRLASSKTIAVSAPRNGLRMPMAFLLSGLAIASFHLAYGFKSLELIASAPFPGSNAFISADLPLPQQGRIPPDRWLARITVFGVIGFFAWSLFLALKSWFNARVSRKSQLTT